MSEELRPESQFCSFRVGNKLYAVDITHIIEIVRWRAATPIPRAPEFIEGYMDLRGAVIPVLDLKKRLEQEPTEADSRTRIIVLRMDRRVLGFIVEEVLEITPVAEGGLRPAPGVDSSAGPHEFIKAVYNAPMGLVLVLDIASVLSTAERRAIQSMETPARLSTGGEEHA